MGIKRRMIDIGKKINFYFLQNVWKCTVFFAFAFKVCKKSNYDPKKIFLKNINMGIKKCRILCWFQIRWCRLKQMPIKKARAKKQCKFWVFSVLCIFSYFFLHLTFVRGISESRHQRIWNQHKILRFFDTHIDIFQEKNLLGHNIIFCIFYCICNCEKNCTFSNILQKVKSYFFGNIYQTPHDSYWNSKKKYKIEAPYCIMYVHITLILLA